MDSNTLYQWNRWCSYSLSDSDLITELQSIKGDTKLIDECFYRDLEFGTGGLRGIIGVGTNRMNIYTVAKATQGYSNYLKKNFTCPSVAIAYDSRTKSNLFAKIAAQVFAANKILVNIFEELMPTPTLSFAVRKLQCSGGIVITASHNPSNYNGYKVYGSDGGQITLKVASDIQTEISTLDIFTDIFMIDFNVGITKGFIRYIAKDIIDAYLNAVSAESLCPNISKDKNISIVYTPLNGTGLRCITHCLYQNNFNNVFVVPEQKMPDGNFPTCSIPNPESKDALELGIQYAKHLKSDLVLATDPDCDRIGVAVRNGGEYVLLSGNEVGFLLLKYICKRRVELGKMPNNPLLIKTIVTSDMAKRIAADYGVQTIDVLTGFKYIGEQIGILEKKGQEQRFILGFEESYGYLTGCYVRDKDAVNAALMICEMYAYFKSIGKSILNILDELYDKYGFYLNTLHSYSFEGIEGFLQMQSIMNKLRNSKRKGFFGYETLSIYDYKKSSILFSDGSTQKIVLPKSDVLKLEFEGDVSIVVRPSGTEPKLKLYISVRADSYNIAKDIERKLLAKIEDIIHEIKQI